MSTAHMREYPGSEVVLPGLADIEAGRESVEASAVRAAASRLRAAGLSVEAGGEETPASHRLYRQLVTELGDGAHSRYNAILARVASFARAAERARTG